jgi:hypothetical protein
MVGTSYVSDSIEVEALALRLSKDGHRFKRAPDWMVWLLDRMPGMQVKPWAITLGRSCYLLPEHWHEFDTRLHEAVHLAQIQLNGFVYFYCSYAWWWWRLGYEAIPWEEEARRIEAKYYSRASDESSFTS